MKVGLSGFSNPSAAEHVCRLFFPGCGLAKEGEQSEIAVTCTLLRQGAEVIIRSQKQTVCAIEPTFPEEGEEQDYLHACAQARALWYAGTQWTGTRPPWGTLTGIRPVRLLRLLMEKQMSEEEAAALLRRQFLVSEPKLDLIRRIRHNEQPLIAAIPKDTVGLYVSIPFCPSRCSYCSFVSHSVEQAGKLIAPYVERLCQEIVQKSELLARCGLRVGQIYIGGGTPTILNPAQLAQVMSTLRCCFERDGNTEFTVEAGRPDTIDAEKLAVIREYGATRICVNPQSMNDGVLAAIGRHHTVADVCNAFSLARKAGMDNINMDLIAGLPAETRESFVASVSRMLALAPDDITLHTLSKKRGSNLDLSAGAEAADTAFMVDYASRALLSAGYEPYYLYRQKNTVANLENVGFCKPGKWCVYNVVMMGECQTVLSCGSGGMNKLVNRKTGNIIRLANTKYPYEYLDRFDAVLASHELLYQKLTEEW